MSEQTDKNNQEELENSEAYNKGYSKGVGFVLSCILFFILCNKIYVQFFKDKNKPKSVTAKNGENIAVIKANQQGNFITSGYVNNHKVTFIVDTGATYVSISTRLALKLNLTVQNPIKLQTANGLAQGWTTTLDSVQISEIKFNNLEASISAKHNFADNEVLLGMNALKQTKFYPNCAQNLVL